MGKELQTWFRRMPGTLQRELAVGLREIVEQHTDAIRSEAPEGETGRTKQSVRMRRGRKTLDYVVEAGGALTTKEVRAGTGIPYDYALAGEFGTQRQAAQPWFYYTHNARKAHLRARIERLVADTVAKA